MAFTLPEPDIQGIVSFFELRSIQRSGDAQIQQTILLFLNLVHFLLHPAAEPVIVHLLGDAGNHLHQRIDDGLLILHQFLEDFRENCVHLTAANLGGRATGTAVAAVHLALPDLLFSFFVFQHLPVEGGVVLLADDFCAVGIPILEADAAAVTHGFFSPFLIQGICTIP